MVKRLITELPAFVFGLFFGSFAGAQCFPGGNWALSEIYSNADGSIQFLELASVSSEFGQPVPTLAGLTLIAGNGTSEHAYTFPRDLPARMSGRPILVGTQGFADLDLLTPDFILPNGFAFIQNGYVKLAGMPWYGGPVEYAALPSDGVNAYWPDAYCEGEAGPAPATAFTRYASYNFSNKSFSFSPNYGGLWWRAPAGSEPGWGIAVEQQDDIVFAAWATFDTDGSPVWFVVPGAESVGGEDASAFYGVIYRPSGPPINGLPFDPSAVSLAPVGTVQLAFGAPGNFSYLIGATYGIKPIARQIFSDLVPVCASGGKPGPVPNYQGLWWNPSEAGRGLHLTQQGHIIFAVWFTYDGAGKATWVTMVANEITPTTYAGAIYRTRGPAYNAAFDPPAVMQTQVGAGTLTFSDRNNGTFSYAIDVAAAQSTNITRQIFADPPTVCN